MTYCIESTLKPKLNCWNLSDQVQSLMKTKHNNDVTHHTGAVYAERKLSCSD